MIRSDSRGLHIPHYQAYIKLPRENYDIDGTFAPTLTIDSTLRKATIFVLTLTPIQ